MEGIIAGIVRRKYVVITIFMLLVIASIALLPFIKVNYDLAQYLPEKASTRQAIAVLEEEFGYPGMADVMVEGVSLQQAVAAKELLQDIDGVKEVVWLDDFVDLSLPLSFVPKELADSYYRDQCALFQVEFAENDYSLATGAALEQIRAVLGDRVSIAGPAENSRHMRGVLASEIFKIILVVLPICLAILVVSSRSWFEPVLYLAVIGVSITINMGTNAFFASVSFITHALAAVLQLAISMDYSLFLSHRFTEERERGLDVVQAAVTATKNSLSSISASSMTTVAGFLSLLFMQYKIGTDIGLVLAKGIAISFFSVILLLPVLLVLSYKLLDRTRRRPLVPPFAKLGSLIVRYRYLLIIAAALIIVPSFLAQQNNSFLYGDTSGSSAAGGVTRERQQIEELFGTSNPVMLLVPRDNWAALVQAVGELEQLPTVSQVSSIVTVADPMVPHQMLPDRVQENFMSAQHSRIIVNLNMTDESPELFAAVEDIEAIAQRHFPGQWLAAGAATSIADIRATVEKDNMLVSLSSILAVGLIILLTFRSASIPVLLVAVIQTSIWINMGVPYFAGTKLVFIGYLVVKALQLGATIDYAILMTNRYLDFRQTKLPAEAATSALQTAGSSVLVSALILSVAGFAEGLLSQIDSISAIGLLLGRGAALSGLLVLVLLPALLVVCDKLIYRTSLKRKFFQEGVEI